MPDNWNTDPTPEDTSRGEMIEIIDDAGHSMPKESEQKHQPKSVTGQKPPPKGK